MQDHKFSDSLVTLWRSPRRYEVSLGCLGLMRTSPSPWLPPSAVCCRKKDGKWVSKKMRNSMMIHLFMQPKPVILHSYTPHRLPGALLLGQVAHCGVSPGGLSGTMALPGASEGAAAWTSAACASA